MPTAPSTSNSSLAKPTYDHRRRSQPKHQETQATQEAPLDHRRPVRKEASHVPPTGRWSEWSLTAPKPCSMNDVHVVQRIERRSRSTNDSHASRLETHKLAGLPSAVTPDGRWHSNHRATVRQLVAFSEAERRQSSRRKIVGEDLEHAAEVAQHQKAEYANILVQGDRSGSAHLKRCQISMLQQSPVDQCPCLRMRDLS